MRLKFAMSTLFVKMSLFFFFKKAEKHGQNCAKIQPPFPLSPLCVSANNVGFRSLRAKTLCVCVSCYWRVQDEGGGGGGGVDFQERV